MDSALVLIGVIAVTLWALFLRSSMISMIWGPIVRSAGGDVALAAVLSVVLYIGGLVAFGLVLLGVHWAFDGLLARAPALVLSLLYAPVAFMPMPDRSKRPFGEVRDYLMKAGATEEQARACAWATGPLAFAGLGVVAGGFFSAFVG
ncbi:hypothetical protein [Actinomadura bangladeshensis]|uniref:Uncharacterized protein n=1 Tax=Actinomadura bangladeshensis TaxID=453573 RepID=A0A6L9QV54_9ACTN|nr:hypothetical protein [Actinomadura bangladeshensis]NEA29395.1 hypothetical protein [Actinomadura bangladeshensis]